MIFVHPEQHDFALSPGSSATAATIPDAAAPRGDRSSPCSERRNPTGFHWLLRLLVGGTFVLAGSLKIADPVNFALAVANYRLLPYEATHLVAILLPWIEVVSGCCVLAGIWERAAAFIVASLVTLFAGAIVSALVRGLNIDCGCFGTTGGSHIGLKSLGIDAVLLLFASLLVWRTGGRPRPQTS